MRVSEKTTLRCDAVGCDVRAIRTSIPVVVVVVSKIYHVSWFQLGTTAASLVFNQGRTDEVS